MSLIRVGELSDIFGEFDWLFRPTRGEMALPDPASSSLEQDDKNYYVRAVVPGFAESELRVDISGNKLTLSGNKETKSEVNDLHSSSRKSFSVSYMLPQDAVVAGDMGAELKDGILVVSVPRKSSSASKLEARTVPIKALGPSSK